jgi:asparagine synthase (glutamine-hydrolysing)
MDWRSTALAGIERLPPGHSLVTDLETVEVRPYHRFSDDAPWEDSRHAHWLNDYRERLTQAVEVRLDLPGPIGAENSGGLDSASLVGLIAQLMPNAEDSIHTFGLMRHELEPQYILETSWMWGITFNHILSPTASRFMEFERIGWLALGHPVEHGNAISHIPFYELARLYGIQILHSGHGGDEVVTNSGSKALVELVAHGMWRQALADVQGPAVLRPARVARLWRNSRQSEKSQMTGPLMERLAWSLLSPEAIKAADIEQRVRSNARYYAPHSTLNGFILNNRLAPHVSTRTAECSIVAAAYGVEYQWPLLDRRLVQQYLSTPAIWKFGEGYGRYLHRRAVEGIVPDKIAWKRGKSMQSGSGSRQLKPPPQEPRLAAPGDLHPLLEDIIDRGRVAQLIGRQGPPESPNIVRNQLRRIDVLNTWLHER